MIPSYFFLLLLFTVSRSDDSFYSFIDQFGMVLQCGFTSHSVCIIDIERTKLNIQLNKLKSTSGWKFAKNLYISAAFFMCVVVCLFEVLFSSKGGNYIGSIFFCRKPNYFNSSHLTLIVDIAWGGKTMLESTIRFYFKRGYSSSCLHHSFHFKRKWWA